MNDLLLGFFEVDQLNRLDVVVIHCDVDSVVPWALGGVNPTITPDPFMDRERRCLSKLVCRDGTKLSQCLADLLGRLEAFILLALLR